MPVWCRSGAGLVLVWSRPGAGLAPVWPLSGAGLVPVWRRSRPGLVPVGSRSGSSLAPVWLRPGSGPAAAKVEVRNRGPRLIGFGGTFESTLGRNRLVSVTQPQILTYDSSSIRHGSPLGSFPPLPLHDNVVGLAFALSCRLSFTTWHCVSLVLGHALSLSGVSVPAPCSGSLSLICFVRVQPCRLRVFSALCVTACLLHGLVLACPGLTFPCPAPCLHLQVHGVSRDFPVLRLFLPWHCLRIAHAPTALSLSCHASSCLRPCHASDPLPCHVHVPVLILALPVLVRMSLSDVLPLPPLPVIAPRPLPLSSSLIILVLSCICPDVCICV